MLQQMLIPSRSPLSTWRCGREMHTPQISIVCSGIPQIPLCLHQQGTMAASSSGDITSALRRGL